MRQDRSTHALKKRMRPNDVEFHKKIKLNVILSSFALYQYIDIWLQ